MLDTDLGLTNLLILYFFLNLTQIFPSVAVKSKKVETRLLIQNCLVCLTILNIEILKNFD